VYRGSPSRGATKDSTANPFNWARNTSNASLTIRIEADHSRLKHRLRAMRGPRTDRTAQTIIAGHAFVQNLRRGHYELGLDATPAPRVAAACTGLVAAI